MNRVALHASLARAWRVGRWLVLAMALLSLHVLLAPWTIQRAQEIRQDWRERQARRDSAQYIAALRTLPDIPLDRFVACARDFRDYLNKEGVKLTVVLWPHQDALMQERGVPQLHPGPMGAVMLQAAKALRREHVKVIDTLPDIHQHLCLHPEDAHLFPDGHLELALRKKLTDQIFAALDPNLITRNGRGLLTAGDCYGYHLGMDLRQHEALAETHIFWRNSGAHGVPYEIAALRKPALQGIHQFIWVVPSLYILHSQSPGSFPPLATSLAQRTREIAGQRTIRAVVEEMPRIPPGLGKDSPYPDALVQCRFHAEEGGNFLGLAHVMQKHEVNPALYWTKDTVLMLTLVPWDSAVQTTPALQHEQILDSTPDFTLPRYFVSAWLHAP